MIICDLLFVSILHASRASSTSEFEQGATARLANASEVSMDDAEECALAKNGWPFNVERTFCGGWHD